MHNLNKKLNNHFYYKLVLYQIDICPQGQGKTKTHTVGTMCNLAKGKWREKRKSGENIILKKINILSKK